ncbi:MAG TPA: tRNA pseudouridine(38-40) synthase TruA [Sphingobacteriaceae bacterium]|nr:tRNA pseudouridine(38-40) synthase TruA [Sphingobacteriaceae bacterium]
MSGTRGKGERRRIKMLVAYDGTDYHGFQVQPGMRTVQAVLEEALGRLAGHPVQVTPAGRTDAGVHAGGQVVHWDLYGSIPVDRLVTALRGLLPQDLVVYRAEETHPDFHARYDAVSKIYRYSILTGPHGWPFIARYVLHHPHPLDVQAIKWAGRLLQGRRDFASFQAAGAATKTTVRNLMRVDVDEQVMAWGRMLHITFEADGFLYHMVRNMVGTLLEIGRGYRGLGWLEEVLNARDRRAAGPTAPAQGLSLVEVKYGR